MKRFKQMDVLNNNRINESELNSEINLEISVLKGLDIFTNAHVLGVVKMTLLMCKKMGYSYDKTKKCVLSAYLHDIGKIKIPPEVLQKSGKLTAEEFEIMKKHTVYGYEICMEYKNFRDLASIVRAHHENLDGTGYPDGLKADEIPEEASLIKVADVYDALTQRRQYKDGYKQSEALRLMLKDVENGKMSEDYYEILLLVVLEDLKSKLGEHTNNVQKYINKMDILHELERIYKQIYDRGLTPKLEKRLKRFELSPGYDMSTNANLLTITQKALEKEIEWKKIVESELVEINKILKDLYKYSDKKEKNR